MLKFPSNCRKATIYRNALFNVQIPWINWPALNKLAGVHCTSIPACIPGLFCPHIVLPILIWPIVLWALTKNSKFQNHYFGNQRSYQKSDTAKRFLGYQTPSGKALAFFNFRALALTVWEIQPLEVLNFWNLTWTWVWTSYMRFILGWFIQGRGLTPVNIATKVSTTYNIITTAQRRSPPHLHLLHHHHHHQQQPAPASWGTLPLLGIATCDAYKQRSRKSSISSIYTWEKNTLQLSLVGENYRQQIYIFSKYKYNFQKTIFGFFHFLRRNDF